MKVIYQHLRTWIRDDAEHPLPLDGETVVILGTLYRVTRRVWYPFGDSKTQEPYVQILLIDPRLK